MKISEFAVKRPVTIVILTSVIIILGFYCYSKIGVELIPNMNIPYAIISTSWSGAGPEEVENQVTKPLESAVNSVSGIKTLTSQSSSGASLIVLEFDWGQDMTQATNDMRDKIEMVQKALPSAAEKPMIMKIDPNSVPVEEIALSSKNKNISLAQLQSMAKDQIKPRLTRLTGVASVNIAGGREREVKVEIDPVKLQNYGLTLSQVNSVLQAENFNMSVGTIREGQREYAVRNLQEFESIDDFKNVAITNTSGNTVYLKDIATISDSFQDASQIVRLNGKQAVTISCMKQTDANTVNTCAAVKAEVKQIEKDFGSDINVTIVSDSSDYINSSLNTTKRMVVEGALLAMLVLFLFLRKMRSALIIFTAIPLSLIATFILMYFSNNTVNMITLGGLSLGLGRMVDDSIVVFENIYRHRLLGMGAVEAATKGATEVGQAVSAGTFTILAVFLPVIFVNGIAGVLFKPLAFTICCAILCSLLVALTVVPLLSCRVLTDDAMQQNVGPGKLSKILARWGNWIDGLGDKYKVLLHWALTHRRKVVIGVTVLLVGSLCLLPVVGAEFMPSSDSGQLTISIKTDRGNSLADTDQVVTRVEHILHGVPEVKYVTSQTGGGDNMGLTSATQSNTGSLTVQLVPKNERRRNITTVAEAVRQQVKDIPGAKIDVQAQDATSMGSSSPIDIKIKGNDLNVLKQLSNQVADIVKTVPGTREVSSSLSDGNPEIQVQVDRQRAAAAGLTPAQVSAGINNAIQGTVATTYRVGGDDVNVRVRYKQAGSQKHDLQYLEDLTILTAKGIPVKLSQIASFTIAEGPTEIDRENQIRQASVTADLLNRDVSSATKDVQKRLAQIKLPSGYEISYGGSNQDMMDSFASLGGAMLLSLILVYAVMAIQYESFFNPFVIMFSIPTAIIGVILSLLLTGRAISVNALIGVIMLIGIVVSNAIVLVDYLNRLRRQGMERDAAIMEAGRIRLRPILMTAFATILAMFPLALGLGEGAESMAPLATVVIGGLLVSTFVTLLLVPVVYSIFDDWGRKIANRRQRRKPKQQMDLPTETPEM